MASHVTTTMTTIMMATPRPNATTKMRTRAEASRIASGTLTTAGALLRKTASSVSQGECSGSMCAWDPEYQHCTDREPEASPQDEDQSSDDDEKYESY